MKKIFILIIAILFFVTIKGNDVYAYDNTSILNAVNEYRISNGLNPLAYDSAMQTASDTRAKESIEVWSHTRPDGTPYYTANDLIYGENLYYIKGEETSETRILNAWIESPSHNANLLEGRFKTACVGINNGFIALEFGL